MAVFARNERGFILIAAIWLLILCGSIAALVLARTMNAAVAAAGEEEAYRTELALEAAVETALADLLINGAASRFARLPAESAIPLPGTDVTVRASADSGRLDLNSAAPELVERLLAGLGWDAAERADFLRRLEAEQDGGGLRNLDQLRWLTATRPRGGEEECLEALLTVFSGRSEPDFAHSPPRLAQLLGATPAASGGTAPPGTPIRLEAQAESGRTLTAIVRVGGLLERPVLRMAWEHDRGCRGGSGAGPEE